MELKKLVRVLQQQQLQQSLYQTKKKGNDLIAVTDRLEVEATGQLGGNCIDAGVLWAASPVVSCPFFFQDEGLVMVMVNFT